MQRTGEYSLGIDLGGTSIKAVAVTQEGRTLQKAHLEFATTAGMEWAEKIRALVQQFLRDHGSALASIGLSAPGLAAADGRSIAYMPGRLQGLEGLDWTEFLRAPKPVLVLNDAHAALSGEAWVGAARGFQNVILLTLGTGVGGAAIVDGQLLRGHIGRAGHLGHICLDLAGPPDCTGVPGTLEAAIGNCTVMERTGGRQQTTHELVAAHRAGDAQATIDWLKSVRALACAVSSFANILDPEAVIIGGGVALAGDALFEPLRKFMEEVEWRPGGARVRILPAELGEFAGAVGAAGRSISLSR
jgi:glucokinase